MKGLLGIKRFSVDGRSTARAGDRRWAFATGTRGGTGRLEALATRDQDHALAAGTLQLQHRVSYPGEQSAAVATQIACWGGA
jgi:hypothetical protein